MVPHFGGEAVPISEVSLLSNISDASAAYLFMELVKALHSVPFVCGLAINTAVVAMILRFNNMRKVTNIYLTSLAVANIVYLFDVPFTYITLLYKRWVFGSFLCKLRHVMVLASTTSFAFTILALTLHKYASICAPAGAAKEHHMRFSAYSTTAAVWLVSLMFCVPVFMYADVSISGDALACQVNWACMNGHGYLVYSFLLMFVVPVFLSIVFCGLTMFKLHNSLRCTSNVVCTRARKQCVNTIRILLIVYVIMWLPYWVNQFLMQNVDHLRRNEWFTVWFTVGELMTYTNCVASALFFVFLLQSFRECIAGILMCKRLNYN